MLRAAHPGCSRARLPCFPTKSTRAPATCQSSALRCSRVRARCQTSPCERRRFERWLFVRRRSLRPHRSAADGGLLSLHSLPTEDRHFQLGAGEDRREHPEARAGRGIAQGVAASSGRPREAVLLRVRLAPLQPQSRRSLADERATRRVRRRSRHPAELALVRRLRGALGAHPRRRAGALQRGQAQVSASMQEVGGPR